MLYRIISVCPRINFRKAQDVLSILNNALGSTELTSIFDSDNSTANPTLDPCGNRDDKSVLNSAT